MAQAGQTDFGPNEVEVIDLTKERTATKTYYEVTSLARVNIPGLGRTTCPCSYDEYGPILFPSTGQTFRADKDSLPASDGPETKNSILFLDNEDPELFKEAVLKMPHPKLVQDGILKAFIDSTALGPEVLAGIKVETLTVDKASVKRQGKGAAIPRSNPGKVRTSNISRLLNQRTQTESLDNGAGTKNLPHGSAGLNPLQPLDLFSTLGPGATRAEVAAAAAKLEPVKRMAAVARYHETQDWQALLSRSGGAGAVAGFQACAPSATAADGYNSLPDYPLFGYQLSGAPAQAQPQLPAAAAAASSGNIVGEALAAAAGGFAQGEVDTPDAWCFLPAPLAGVSAYSSQPAAFGRRAAAAGADANAASNLQGLLYPMTSAGATPDASGPGLLGAAAAGGYHPLAGDDAAAAGGFAFVPTSLAAYEAQVQALRASQAPLMNPMGASAGYDAYDAYAPDRLAAAAAGGFNPLAGDDAAAGGFAYGPGSLAAYEAQFQALHAAQAPLMTPWGVGAGGAGAGYDACAPGRLAAAAAGDYNPLAGDDAAAAGGFAYGPGSLAAYEAHFQALHAAQVPAPPQPRSKKRAAAAAASSDSEGAADALMQLAAAAKFLQGPAEAALDPLQQAFPARGAASRSQPTASKKIKAAVKPKPAAKKNGGSKAASQVQAPSKQASQKAPRKGRKQAAAAPAEGAAPAPPTAAADAAAGVATTGGVRRGPPRQEKERGTKRRADADARNEKLKDDIGSETSSEPSSPRGAAAAGAGGFGGVGGAAVGGAGAGVELVKMADLDPRLQTALNAENGIQEQQQ